jgi:hypothetical protein
MQNLGTFIGYLTKNSFRKTIIIFSRIYRINNFQDFDQKSNIEFELFFKRFTGTLTKEFQDRETKTLCYYHFRNLAAIPIKAHPDNGHV